MNFFLERSVSKIAIGPLVGSRWFAQRPEKAATCHPVLAIKETIFGQKKNNSLISYFAFSCPSPQLNVLSHAVGHKLLE